MTRVATKTAGESIAVLERLSRTFGGSAAATKRRLLETLADAPSSGGAAAERLDDLLGFMRAYPDSPAVLHQVRQRALSLPDPAPVVYSYSYDVVRRLIDCLPGRLEIEWEELEDQSALLDTLSLLVSPAEELGLEDTSLTLVDWFARCRPPDVGDLEFLLRLLEASPLPSTVRSHLYDRCDLPIRVRHPRRSQVAAAVGPVSYQRRVIPRDRRSIRPAIRRPMPPVRRGGRSLVDVALQALAARTLEIYPLTYANPDDVLVAECGRGLRVVLIGVRPEHRSPLESLYVFLIVKNGVPIAYGPAGVFLGCCEMGINLFPEFRGGEIRRIYAQFMRTMYHLLGVEYFYLTRYGMGENNEPAIATGAFWFYRKLGFRATNAAVERLAQAEEARMRDEPGYRSGRRMLRRLSRTEAVLDLSGGRCTRFDFGRLGVAASRRVATVFDGDRDRALRAACARLARLLDMPSDALGLRLLAPLLDLMPDLEAWRRTDLLALARIIVAKGARSERRAALGFKAHHRLARALRAAAEPVDRS